MHEDVIPLIEEHNVFPLCDYLRINGDELHQLNLGVVCKEKSLQPFKEGIATVQNSYLISLASV